MKYNGHKNWNHWNVALWLFNDEFLYIIMKGVLRSRTKDEAAEYLLGILGEETPDGAPYSKTSIRAALVGDI
tara:strand:- start:22 stop:237 length:216 start_codon:yes stop_codon:yes gene_type:complete